MRLPYVVPIVLLGLANVSSAEVQVTQTANAVTISNGATTLAAQIWDGRTNAFRLVDATSDDVLAQIEIGGLGRWTAGCSAESNGRVGSIKFHSIDTSATGRVPEFSNDSEIHVELHESDPFPVVRFRLRAERFDKATWEKAVGGRIPIHFLSCRMDEAQFFYRGGFHSPSPTVDVFSIRSSSMRGEWDGDWSCAAEMRACPVPAVGLWDTQHSHFVAYEFQEARSSDKSSKHIASAYCGGLPNDGRQFVTLMLAEGSVVESRFRLLYSTQLPPTASPNRLVLQHIWNTYRDNLPRAPGTSDLGCLPGRDQFLPDDQTTATFFHRVRKNSRHESIGVFTDNTLVPSGDYRGTLNLLQEEKGPRQERLLQQWALLREKAIRRRIGEDDCVFWRFPVEGDYEPSFGNPAASEHSPATWRIGASLLAMYRATKDAALLEYIDGIFRWTRHCSFTRAGDPSLPGATSIVPAHVCAVEFLLNYHHLFQNDSDAQRRATAEEAIALGHAVLYRCLAIYTDDPDETDQLDPTFLIQVTSARSAAGCVSWKDTGELTRAMVLYHTETGDPLLEYLVRGVLQRYHIGVESDGFHRIETVDVLGIGEDTKGRRMGLSPLDDVFAGSLQPIGSARVRVLCGRKAAFAVCSDIEAQVRDYQFTKDGDVRFTLAADRFKPIDINVTAPLRDLRGKRIVVNGKEVETQIIGRHGENAVVRNVSPHLLPSTEPQDIPETWGDATFVKLPSNVTLDTSWENGLSWAGLNDGVHFAWGVPFRISTGDMTAVDLAKGPTTVKPSGKLADLFVFAASSPNAPSVKLTYADGMTHRQQLGLRLPALASSPIRNWQIDLYPVTLQRPDKAIASIEVSGDTLLFAMTMCQSRNPAFQVAVAEQEAKRKAKEVEAKAAREKAQAVDRMVPESRAQVAAATLGKTLRIGFLPPHEAYTDTLRTACGSLGVPPVLLSPEEIIDPQRFNARRYPIVVYSSGETFLHTVAQPGDAAAALKRYVAEGGCLVVAAYGYPLFYATRFHEGRYERIEEIRPGETCAALEIPIAYHTIPPLEEMPSFALAPDQQAFTHLPARFRYDRSAGTLYRPMARQGFPAADVLRPLIALEDGKGQEHGLVAAIVEHNCENYEGGRTIFLWGNILGMEIGSTIALDLMRYAICTAKLEPGQMLEPKVAILPRDMAGHDQAIQVACSRIGLKTQVLTPEQFVDPAVFNSRNFPIAIHAVRNEYYLNRCAGRSDLWQVYADYVKGGGFLVACGNMSQFFYAGTLTSDGKWQQAYDPAQRVTSELGLKVVTSRIPNPRKMLLRSLPDQTIVDFSSPVPLEYLNWGSYRAVDTDDMFNTDFVPLAEVTDEQGRPLGGYAIAVMRYKSRELRGAELLWMWGDLLNDARTHPLLNQAIQYAHKCRHQMFDSPE